PGDTADVSQDVPGEVFRQRSFQRDVADGDTAAGPEDAEHFAEDGELIGGEIDDAVADEAIDGCIGQRQPVDGGEVELDVRQPLFGRVAPRRVNHLRRHVHADGFAGRADLGRRQQYVDAAAATEVHDGFAGAQTGESGRVAAGEAEVG